MIRLETNLKFNLAEKQVKNFIHYNPITHTHTQCNRVPCVCDFFISFPQVEMASDANQ